MSRQLQMFGWSAARCAIALVLVLAASIAHAQNSSVWVDETLEEGGWMDTQTGLVWVDYRIVSGSWWPWKYARDLARDYVDPTGHSNWRLPTVAELQAASNKEIYKYVPTQDAWHTDTEVRADTGYWYWSSEFTKKKGGQAWAVRLMTTVPQPALWTQGFACAVMFVREVQ